MDTFQLLPWDTDFFGIPTYTWPLKGESATVLEAGIEQLRVKGARLCYLEVDDADTGCLQNVQALGIRAVDAKTTYLHTNPAASAVVDSRVIPQTGAVNQPLISLGLAAGAYSRFALDAQLPPEAYKKLYAIWTQRSIDRQIAFQVLITGTQSVPTGLLTLGSKNNRGDIGLVSVDAATRGQGLGSALVRHSLHVFVENGHNQVQVVTQGANKEACGLYEKCGFVKERVTHIFHLHL